MSADLVLTLQLQLDSLRSNKARIDSEIAEIEGAIKVIEKYASFEDTANARLMNLAFPKPQKTKQQLIIEGVASILSDGKPRHTHDLYVALTAQGIGVGGENSEANLSAYLSREKKLFENDRRNGWSLKKQTSEGVAAPTEAGDLL